MAVTRLGYDRDNQTFTQCKSEDQNELKPGESCLYSCDEKGESYKHLWVGITKKLSPESGRFRLDLLKTREGDLAANSTVLGAVDKPTVKKEDIWNEDCEYSRPSKKQWEQVFQAENKTIKGENILDTTNSEWGQQQGGYKHYLFVVKFYDSTASPNIELKVSYQMPVARRFVVGLRTLFSVLSILYLLYWLAASRNYVSSARRSLSCLGRNCCCCFVGAQPLTRLVFWFLLFVVLWQNPLYMVSSLGEYRGVDLNVVSESINSFGWAFVLVTWLLMVAEAGDFRSRDEDPEPPRKYTFYCLAILFGMVLSIVAILMNIASKPYLFTQGKVKLFGVSHVNDDLKKVAIGLGVLYLLLLVSWVIWFGLVIIISWVCLNEKPYMPTRARQLSVRYLILQITFVALFAIIVDIVPVANFFYHAYQKSSDGDIHADTGKLVGIVQKVSQGYQSIGPYLAVGVHSFFIFYSLLPPSRVGSLEKLFWKMVGTATFCGTGDNRRPFALQEASWIFDLISATNYDPAFSRINTDDRTESPATEDRELTKGSKGPLLHPPHDFVVDGFLYSRRTQTIALIFRKDYRIVVVFRAARGGVYSKVSSGLLPEDSPNTQSLDFSRKDAGCLACIPGLRDLSPRIREDVWERYSSIREGLRRTLPFYLAGNSVKLYCAGYDMGGCLAYVAALDYKSLVAANRREASEGICAKICGTIGAAAMCECCYSEETDEDMTVGLLRHEEHGNAQSETNSSINDSTDSALATLVGKENEEDRKRMFDSLCTMDVIERADTQVGVSDEVDSFSSPKNNGDDIVRVYSFGNIPFANASFVKKVSNNLT